MHVCVCVCEIWVLVLFALSILEQVTRVTEDIGKGSAGGL